MTNENRGLGYYHHTAPITTRWSDNDQYGHVNNSIYYHYFDAVVNGYLVTRCGLDPASTSVHPTPTPTPTKKREGDDDTTRKDDGEGRGTKGGPIGLVVASGCRYHAALAFPQPLVGGLTVAKLGKTSVTYHVGIFASKSSGSSRSEGTETNEGKVEGEGLAAASGFFTHVFVDPVSRRPSPMTARCRAALLRIATPEIRRAAEEESPSSSSSSSSKL